MCPTATSDVLSVLIVGCGDMAGGYDEAREGAEILTHAGAYARHPGFAIAACVDPDEARRREFMERWRIAAGFSDLAACRAGGTAFDVASVCTPVAAHEETLEGLLDMPVRAVFCEKPLTGDVAASRRMVEAFEAAGRPLAVNYFRRWDTSMSALRRSIAEGAWGAVQSVAGHYSKGILNCGSHMIDLLQFLIGPLAAEAVFRRRHDFTPEDPTLDALLATADGAPVYLIGGDSRLFFTFEIDLMMERGRVVIEDLGMVLRRRQVVANPLYPGYECLDRGEWVETGFGQAMVRAVDNLHAHVNGKADLPSDGRSALAAEEVCATLMEMADAVAPPTPAKVRQGEKP